MTPEQELFEQQQCSQFDFSGFRKVLATVRDEARRAALEEATKLIETLELSNGTIAPNRSWFADRIRKMDTPTRTLGNVLGDIDVAFNPQWQTITDGGLHEKIRLIARTAVEGLQSMKNGKWSVGGILDETIRKLLEIK